MGRLLKFGALFLPFFIENYAKIVVFFSVKKPLKNTISIINTQDQGGGAAKIAFQITKYSKYNDGIQFFVHHKKIDRRNIVQINSSIISRFQSAIDKMEAIGGWLDIAKIAPLKLMKNLFFKESKIVHLHNLHGYYFSNAILPSMMIRKKVIWTLHDEQLLTGHCSCTLGCNNWIKGCGNCPNLKTYPSVKVDNTKKMLAYKARWLKEINPLIVCPSQWLASRVKLAFPFLKEVVVVQNGVDIELFKPTFSKKELRKRLNLPIDAFLILFAAELSTKNPFKGGEIINEMLSNGLGENTYLITIGGATKQQTPYHIPYGYIEEEQQMADLYAASDIMIYPTRADNLPIVVLEAMSCGLPVIASNIGGIPEIIEHGINGFVIDSYLDVSAFHEAFSIYKEYSGVQKKEIREKARLKIERTFSKKNMIDAYDEIYINFFN